MNDYLYLGLKASSHFGLLMKGFVAWYLFFSQSAENCVWCNLASQWHHKSFCGFVSIFLQYKKLR